MMRRGLARPKTIVVECKICHTPLEALSMMRIRRMVVKHYLVHHPDVDVDVKASLTAVRAEGARSADSSRSKKSAPGVTRGKRGVSVSLRTNPRAGKRPTLTVKLAHMRLDNQSARIDREHERLCDMAVALARVERIVQALNQQHSPSMLARVVQEREEARNIVRLLASTGIAPLVSEHVRTQLESWRSKRPGLTRDEGKEVHRG